MNKKVLLIIGGAVLLLCALCVGGVIVTVGLGFGLTQPAATAGDAFMTALQNGDYNGAFNLCAPALQKELGSPQGLESRIKNSRVQPTQWSFTSRNISGSEGQLDGSVTFANNREGTVRLVLVQVGSDWKISGFSLSEK